MNPQNSANFIKSILKITAVIWLIFTASAPAMANESSKEQQALLDKFITQLHYYMNDIAYETAEFSENGFLLKGITFIANNQREPFASLNRRQKREFKGTAESISARDISEVDGGLTIGALTIKAYEIKAEDTKITIQEAGGTQVLLAQNGKNYKPWALDESNRYATTITITHKDKPIATIDALSLVDTHNKTEMNINSRQKIKGITLHLDALDKLPRKSAIIDLGYGTIKGEINSQMQWNYQTGEFTLENIALTLEEMGRFDLTAAIQNYNKAHYLENQQLLNQLHDDPQNREAAEKLADSFGLLALDNFALKFTDAKFTNRLIEYISRHTRLSKHRIIASAKLFPRLFLSSAGFDDLASQLNDALEVFLNKPNALELKSNAEKPIPFSRFRHVLGEEERGQALAKELNLSIKAIE